MIARTWHASIAVVVAVAVIVQLVVTAGLSSTPSSHAVGLVAGTHLLGRLIRVFSFFTIDSNLLSGLVSAQLALRPDRDGPAWRALRLCAVFGITVTGIVYSTVLAPVHDPRAGAETFVNTLVHYVVPVLMVLGWLAFGPRPRIDGRTIGVSLLFPVGWLAYTLVRGAIWGWYPYPFMDVTGKGYLQVALNAVGVTAVLVVVAALYALGDRRLGPAPDRDAARPVEVRGRA
jgi:hypothetical protein